jgi:anti-sigma factor RsiW
VIGHLGARVSALLDGQLSPDDAEEAWAHVYACHACRDLVEREGWIKSQLACWAGGGTTMSDEVSDTLKGSLRDLTPGERYALDPRASAALPARGHAGRRAVAVVGSGAAGAAMLGVLALGWAPASTQPSDRRPPATGVTAPSPVGSVGPASTRRPGASTPVTAAVTPGSPTPSASPTSDRR